MKLRTMKAGGRGAEFLWFEVKRDWFVCAPSRYEANAQYIRIGPGYGQPLDYLKRDYDLLDVTDTGEPLKGTECGAYNPSRTHKCDLPAGHEGMHTFDGWLGWLNEHDTPPQPGDRVRVTYEAEYVMASDWIPAHMVRFPTGRTGTEDTTALTPKDAEIQVIARAKPAVPEEPDCIYVVEDKDEVIWVRLAEDRGYNWETSDKRFDNVGWEDLWAERGPLRQYTRGPVIG